MKVKNWPFPILHVQPLKRSLEPLYKTDHEAQFRSRASAVQNLIVFRFDCIVARQTTYHSGHADVVTESYQIRDLLKPRKNSPRNLWREGNPPKHINIMYARSIIRLNELYV